MVEQGIFLSLVHSEANGPGLTDEGLRHQAPAFEAPECGARAQESRNIDMLMDIPVVLSVELGSRKMAISEILNIGQGSVIELNKEVGEPVDILVNNTLVAKGEVVVIEEHFGVRVTEIADTRARLESLRG